MRSLRSTISAVVAAALLAVSIRAEPEPSEAMAPRLTLRLRDVPLATVLHTLFRLTRQGYVGGGDLVGHMDVEIVDATADEVERTLEATGLAFSEPGKLRRVTLAAEPPTLDRSGSGHPISLDWEKPADMRDVLRLFQEITGDVFVAPTGPLGHFVLFSDQVPVDDALRAALSATGLDSRREPGRVLVFRRTDPKALLLPLDAGGRHAGHVGYRVGEAGPGKRSAGINGILVSESRLVGLARAGETWMALLEYPSEGLVLVQEGQRLYDGTLESITFDRIVFKTDDGRRSELLLPTSEGGIVRKPDSAKTTVTRAVARADYGDFDEADRTLRTALAAGTDANEAKVLRAGLADTHYRWGQVLADRYANEEAIRHFEEAYAIDGPERPWQAGEDLNEIGFLWTALGEPVRAEDFHRRALEVSRTAEAKKQPPRGGACVRYHLRADWSKAAALDGLANAERLRGRFAEAATLYEQALEAWKEAGDAAGATAALTGLGLVRHGQGRYAEALALHRRALENPLPNPPDRAAILDNIGSAQLALGPPGQARATFMDALAIYRKVGDRAGEGTVLNNLGAAWEASDRTQACAHYADALVASRDAGDRRGAAITERHLQRLIDTGAADDRSLDRCRAALSLGAGPR
jgi:tetratricopeptide (TPR) repeat protein